MTLRDRRACQFGARGNSVDRSLAAHACARQLVRFQCQLKLKISGELRIGEASAADWIRKNQGYLEFGEIGGVLRYDAAG
jgi:hypothetical protein